MREVIVLGLTPPKGRETYQTYVSRMFKQVKRNKKTLRGAYSGRGRNIKLHAPVVMKAIGGQWRKHQKSIKKAQRRSRR